MSMPHVCVGPVVSLCNNLAGDNIVVGAYVSTVGRVAAVVAAEQDGGAPPSARPAPLTLRPDDEPALLCYLDGSFPISRPPGSPPADRGLMVMNAYGQVGLVAAGPRASLRIIAP